MSGSGIMLGTGRDKRTPPGVDEPSPLGAAVPDIDIDSAAEAAFTRMSEPEAQPAEDTSDDSETLEVPDEPEDDDVGSDVDDGQPAEPEDTSDTDADEVDEDTDAPRPDVEDIPEDAAELDPEATFVVEVDGERVALTGQELRNGYLRHDDYTRKRQAEAAKLAEAEERAETLETKAAEADEAREKLEQAEQWFQERANNPTAWAAEILAGASDGDPARTTAYLGKAIVDLAEAGLVTPKFAEHFGLNVPDNPVRKAAQDGDVTSRLERVESTLTEREQREAEERQQREQQQALIDEYRQQWERVKDIGDLEFDGPEAEAKIRAELAEYAIEHDQDDLVTAFLMMEREKLTAAGAAAADKMKTNGQDSGKEKAASQAAVNRSSTRSTRAKPGPAKDLDEAAERALAKMGYQG